jgi:hypothetical protein
VSHNGSQPDLPLVALRTGISVGAGVIGLAAVVIALAVSSKPTASLISILLFSVIFGGFTWLASRHRQEYLRVNLDRVTGGKGRRGPRQAFILGLLLAGILTVVEALVAGLLDWSFGDTSSVTSAVPGLLLGVFLWVTLDLRDLRRWEVSSGCLVFTRAGSRRLAFTYGQARHHLVAVDRKGESCGPVDI